MGRLFRIAIVIGLLGLFLVAPAQAGEPNLIKNGSFEEGFDGNGIGKEWKAFHNGGHVVYGWHPDNWKPVVWDGQWSQLIEINTGGQEGIEKDRYAGIFQTVDVVPGATYRLTIRGMVRSTEGSTAVSQYGYRVQWAMDYNGGSDWQALDKSGWQELNWYEWPRTSPGWFETFSTDVKATSAKMTLYVRCWKKWGTPNQEADYNFDGISLVGPAAGSQPAPSELPQTGLGLAAPLAGLALGALALGVRKLRAYRAS